MFSGSGAKRIFQNEAGGHRWQRVSPTEKRGRVHTSTVTVAVLEPLDNPETELDLSEVEIKDQRGSGPGGQHRNKTNSCITATHTPTGISVRIDARSQFQSRKLALSILAQKLRDIDREQAANSRDAIRRGQVGSGMRSDKVRTYRERDNQVKDHRTGQTWRLDQWRKGNW